MTEATPQQGHIITDKYYIHVTCIRTARCVSTVPLFFETWTHGNTPWSFLNALFREGNSCLTHVFLRPVTIYLEREHVLFPCTEKKTRRNRELNPEPSAAVHSICAMKRIRERTLVTVEIISASSFNARLRQSKTFEAAVSVNKHTRNPKRATRRHRPDPDSSNRGSRPRRRKVPSIRTTRRLTLMNRYANTLWLVVLVEQLGWQFIRN